MNGFNSLLSRADARWSADIIHHDTYGYFAGWALLMRSRAEHSIPTDNIMIVLD